MPFPWAVRQQDPQMENYQDLYKDRWGTMKKHTLREGSGLFSQKWQMLDPGLCVKILQHQLVNGVLGNIGRSNKWDSQDGGVLGSDCPENENSNSNENSPMRPSNEMAGLITSIIWISYWTTWKPLWRTGPMLLEKHFYLSHILSQEENGFEAYNFEVWTPKHL